MHYSSYNLSHILKKFIPLVFEEAAVCADKTCMDVTNLP
jgi:hypothetical protein